MLNRRNFFLAEWFFVLLALLALGGYLGFSTYQDYRRTERDELARLAQQASIVEHNLVPQLVAANQALLSIIEDMSRWRREKDFGKRIGRRLEVLNNIVPGVRTLVVVDARGEIIASSNTSVVGSRVSNRDWFRLAQVNNSPQTLYVTPPFKSLVSATSVAFVRSMSGPNGEFSGAVFGAVHPDFAKVLLSSVVYTPDTLASLVHADGTVFASTDESLVGKDLSMASSLFSRHREAGQATTTQVGLASVTGDKRIIAQRTIQPTGLGMNNFFVVGVTRSFDAVFATWRAGAALAAAMFAALALAAIGGLALYQRLRLRNAAELLRSQSALRQSEQRFSTAFAAAPIAVSITKLNDGSFVEANRNFERLFGWTPEEIIGNGSGEFSVWPDAQTRAPWAQAMQQHGELVDYETIWLHKDGQRRHVSISAVLTNVDGEACILAYTTDISARKLAEETINTLAFYDQLTGLPNRQLMLDRLKQAITMGGRSGYFGALLFVDLDHFKVLNETLGHDAGDVLLQQVAQRLIQCLRDGDTVARVGGDEFVVILANLSTNIEDAAAGTEKVAEKILAQLNQVHQLDGAAHNSGASLGMTLFQGQDTSADDLLKQAELAMYRIKETGRNGMHFFDPEMETAVLKHVALERSLRAALQAKEFVLHYQPLVVDAGRLTGAEALVRWQHPQRGMVSPAEFIPIAEETGLIVPLGQWVLETACTQLALWALRPDFAHLTIAVNVSAHQFRQIDFVEQVLAALEMTGANAHRLKLELTESLLVSNVQDTIEKMFTLKAKGIEFSLDDFGTGYSSLTYLKRLPLAQLKIDQSFVRDVLVDANDATIAKTIVTLAQSLGLAVIAEGVETQAQKDFLASNGCHAYQGYFFSKPLPIAQFEAFAQLAVSDCAVVAPAI
jgi:diguanylate cyclase (GGDEF)-like protein/PAS domain S-box-containing protein